MPGKSTTKRPVGRPKNPNRPAKREFFMVEKVEPTLRHFDRAKRLLQAAGETLSDVDVFRRALVFTVRYHQWVMENHPDFNDNGPN